MHWTIRFALVAFVLLPQSQSFSQVKENSNGDTLTFLSHRSGQNELYASKSDARDARAIFGGPIKEVPAISDKYQLVREPHWTRQSPDGRMFASWVYEFGEPFSEYQGALRAMLVVGDIKQTWSKVVSPDAEEEFAWAPDSKRLAFSILSTANYQGTLQKRTNSTQIMITGYDGSNHDTVFEQPGLWIVLDWSPDGTRLLVSRREFEPQYSSTLYEFRLQEALAAKRKAGFDPSWNETQAKNFLTSLKTNLNGLQVSGARYSPTRQELAIEALDPKKMYAPNLVADDELGRMSMMRSLGKILVADLQANCYRKVADHDDGIRGPICWGPNGDDVYYSRFLPRGDDREKMAVTKEHGLSIWSVKRDGSNPKFICTGWSPDFSHIQKP